MSGCLRVNMEREGTPVRSIYYGRIGSEATERLLERKAPFVHTYRLIHSTDGWSLQDTRVSLQSFSTLERLIEAYRRATVSDVGMVPLIDPLDKRQLQSSLGQECTYMEMSSSSSVY
ncbi:uncharacterized protein LOC114450292 isoform X2 [Parambassis ranga]|uniref:Uncharacterized protein LOC114450292 isoform X2 n=1 Tax=Parambassis ranga TaxID=210632 RepID=A0A6P7K440_9TELE|nr:uncharacterized protein LOC114450292 isoform X2 [Parambassis ranga]